MTSVPTPIGRRTFIAGAAGTTAAVALSSTASAAVPAGASYYAALDPRRLADTRTYPPYSNVYKDFQRLSPTTIRIKVAGAAGIPGDAVAAVISIAAINNGLGGWVRATPAGQDSNVANVLMDPQDSVVTNLATVKLSDGSTPGIPAGYVDIKGVYAYDVIVDISGVYRPTTVAPRGGRLEHLPEVVRLKHGDLVGDGGILSVPVALGPAWAPAAAAVVNLTAAFTTQQGYLTAFPKGLSQPPVVSNVNFGVGDTRGAGAIVKLGEKNGVKGFDIFVRGQANVYVDLAGYITGDNDADIESGLFVPIVGTRLLDTRTKADVAKSGKRRLWPGWTRSFEVSSISGGQPVGGVVMNLTSVTSMGPGYITVLGAQTPRAVVSNLNVSRAGQTVANHVITRASTKGVECYSRSGADIVCDVGGWYVGTPQTATLGPPVDPPAPPAALPWTVHVPVMGLFNKVEGHSNPDRVVDRGESWHWTNTGLVGETAAIVAFGHRTAHGGPYRYQHYLNGNSYLEIYTPDLRKYTYRWVREELTSDAAADILAASRRVGGPTFTLVACTGPKYGAPNDQPLGEVTYRIVSTFVLVSWEDTAPTID